MDSNTYRPSSPKRKGRRQSRNSRHIFFQNELRFYTESAKFFFNCSPIVKKTLTLKEEDRVHQFKIATTFKLNPNRNCISTLNILNLSNLVKENEITQTHCHDVPLRKILITRISR